MREKLIEILSVPIYPHELVDPIEAVADYLIDNGVTIQKWTPATERLPVKRFFVLVFTSDKIVGEAIMDNDGKFYWANTNEDAEPLDVTHWMPLPEPPSGERRTDDRETG